MKKGLIELKPLVAIVQALLSFTIAHAEEATKPAVPAFRARLDAGEFQTRAASLLAGSETDIEKLRASKLPEWGVVITSVTPGGQAAEAGMEIGWRIDRLDGEEYWHHKMGMGRGGAAREVEAVLPTGERKKFQFRPGKIGINCSNGHLPELYVLRNVSAGLWDRNLLIAVRAWEDGQQDLAETALHHAVEKGLPLNALTKYYGAMLALDRGDTAASREMLDPLLAEVTADGNIPRFFRPGIRTLALGLGDYPLLRKAIAELAGMPRELQEQTVATWERNPPPVRSSSLLDQAAAATGPDLMPEIITVNDGWEKTYRIKDPEPLRDGAYQAMTLPPDYDDYCFMPSSPVQDVIWEIHGAYGNVKAPQTFHEMSFELIDLEKRAKALEYGAWHPPLWVVAGIRIRREAGLGTIVSLVGGPSEVEIPTRRFFPQLQEGQMADLVKSIYEKTKSPLPDEASFRLTLIRIGGEMELRVNGVSYLRLPVPADVKNLGCVIHQTGMAMAIDKMTLKAISGKR